VIQSGEPLVVLVIDLAIFELSIERAHFDTAARPERGHSCPQLRWNVDERVWTAEISRRSGVADRNVRAPAAVSGWAPIEQPVNTP